MKTCHRHMRLPGKWTEKRGGSGGSGMKRDVGAGGNAAMREISRSETPMRGAAREPHHHHGYIVAERGLAIGGVTLSPVIAGSGGGGGRVDSLPSHWRGELDCAVFLSHHLACSVPQS